MYNAGPSVTDVIIDMNGYFAAPTVGGAPAITSATSASGTVGTAFSYQITATNSPASYSATGLPGGLSVNTSTGLVSGTPTAAGTSTVTLGATNAGGTGNATLTLSVSTGGPLTITTASCPAGTQGAPYAGCMITATGGTPPYKFSVDTSGNYPPLPEGMSLNASTGAVTSSQIGGQGTYTTGFIVTDAANTTATLPISFAISGNNALLASIFPATSIFHHRVDAATTGLPVDTSPAAPMYSGYLSSTIRVFFGQHVERAVSERNTRVPGSQQPAGCAGFDHRVSILFHVWPHPGECSGGRHQLLERRPARPDLPAGRWQQPSGSVGNVAGNL